MARPQRWEVSSINDGVMEVKLSSWKYFHDYVVQEMLRFSHYIWRGQRDSAWALESSLYRLMRDKKRANKNSIAKAHLAKFKMAARGRRGANPDKIVDDNEWWALGQHQGLATPLLDWTESPFVALYFAFEKSDAPISKRRSVWSLGNVTTKNNALKSALAEAQNNKLVGESYLTLDRFRPTLDENARLVAQAGLFTRGPLGVTVDDWVKTYYADQNDGAMLLKITIPDDGRHDCLKTLNKMNINHLTLFPDIYGTTQHCNKAIEINKY